MEPQQNKVESVMVSLKKVTPLSKYLAMTLFIILPFLGGWVGYNYAPDKIVEVERVVVVEKEKESLKSESIDNSFASSTESTIVSIEAVEKIENGKYFFESSQYKLSFDLPSTLNIWRPDNGHHQFFVFDKNEPKNYILDITIEPKIDEYGNILCHSFWCEKEIKSVIKTKALTWNYLGGSSFCIECRYREMYTIFADDDVLILNSDFILHSSSSPYSQIFESIDFEPVLN